MTAKTKQTDDENVTGRDGFIIRRALEAFIDKEDNDDGAWSDAQDAKAIYRAWFPKSETVLVHNLTTGEHIVKRFGRFVSSHPTEAEGLSALAAIEGGTDA